MADPIKYESVLPQLLTELLGTTQKSSGGTTTTTSGGGTSVGSSVSNADTDPLRQIFAQQAASSTPEGMQALLTDLFTKGAQAVPALTQQFANSSGVRVDKNSGLNLSLNELNKTLAQQAAALVGQQQQSAAQTAGSIANATRSTTDTRTAPTTVNTSSTPATSVTKGVNPTSSALLGLGGFALNAADKSGLLDKLKSGAGKVFGSGGDGQVLSYSPTGLYDEASKGLTYDSYDLQGPSSLTSAASSIAAPEAPSFLPEAATGGSNFSLGDTLGSFGNTLGNTFSGVGDAIGNAASSVGDSISSGLSDLGDSARNFFDFSDFFADGGLVRVKDLNALRQKIEMSRKNNGDEKEKKGDAFADGGQVSADKSNMSFQQATMDRRMGSESAEGVDHSDLTPRTPEERATVYKAISTMPIIVQRLLGGLGVNSSASDATVKKADGGMVNAPGYADGGMIRNKNMMGDPITRGNGTSSINLLEQTMPQKQQQRSVTESNPASASSSSGNSLTSSQVLSSPALLDIMSKQAREQDKREKGDSSNNTDGNPKGFGSPAQNAAVINGLATSLFGMALGPLGIAASPVASAITGDPSLQSMAVTGLINSLGEAVTGLGSSAAGFGQADPGTAPAGSNPSNPGADPTSPNADALSGFLGLNDNFGTSGGGEGGNSHGSNDGTAGGGAGRGGTNASAGNDRGGDSSGGGSGGGDGGAAADGGMMRGPGDGISDSIHARLSDGEYVLSKDVVDAVGVPFLDSLQHHFHTPAALQKLQRATA